VLISRVDKSWQVSTCQVTRRGPWVRGIQVLTSFQVELVSLLNHPPKAQVVTRTITWRFSDRVLAGGVKIIMKGEKGSKRLLFSCLGNFFVGVSKVHDRGALVSGTAASWLPYYCEQCLCVLNCSGGFCHETLYEGGVTEDPRRRLG